MCKQTKYPFFIKTYDGKKLFVRHYRNYSQRKFLNEGCLGTKKAECTHRNKKGNSKLCLYKARVICNLFIQLT